MCVCVRERERERERKKERERERERVCVCVSERERERERERESIYMYALTLVDYLPALQSTHEPAPTDEEYLCIAYTEGHHWGPRSLHCALHLQSVNAELPAGDMDFFRQGRHSELSPEK